MLFINCLSCDTCLSCNLRKRKKRLIWKFKSQSQKCVNNIFPSSFSHLIIFIETIINFFYEKILQFVVGALFFNQIQVVLVLGWRLEL